MATLVAEARKEGDSRRGAEVFLDARFSCTSCHKVGPEGGIVGPELSTAGACLSRAEIAESVLWPRRKIKEGYEAIALATDDGKVIQGYPREQTERDIVFTEATTSAKLRISRSSVEEIRKVGTLMPEGIAATMSPRERRDLVRFLLELGKPGNSSSGLLRHHPHAAATFPFDREPLQPDRWPNWQQPVKRERIYDFYAKEAEYFRRQSPVPLLLPPFPGLDGGSHGHWGNQNENSWADSRWNQTALGTVLCGVFRGAGVTVPKGVCVRLGDRNEMRACFNPETLSYEALWRDGFVKFSATRHGFVDGLIMSGTALPRPQATRPEKSFVYRGFFRHGPRVIFAYRIGGEDYLDGAWVEDGKFTRRTVPASDQTLAKLTGAGHRSGRRC